MKRAATWWTIFGSFSLAVATLIVLAYAADPAAQGRQSLTPRRPELSRQLAQDVEEVAARAGFLPVAADLQALLGVGAAGHDEEPAAADQAPAENTPAVRSPPTLTTGVGPATPSKVLPG